MNRIETLPIYFKTDDQRINAFLEKNRLHHQLTLKSQNKAYPSKTGGNGNIRRFLAFSAVALFWFLVATDQWGWW